ncbi:MAG: DUF1223 domain-containing protein [Aquaticitalea sp.]
MKLVLLSLIVLLTSHDSIVSTIDTKDYEAIVVLELFTSQGCSSCPPADELLKEITKEYSDSEVLALSYHVDYWDQIGWKDPFSKSEFSDLQRTYAHKFNNSSIYTPQMVINGKEHFVGSKESVLRSKIKSYSNKSSKNSISVSNVKKNNASISFNYQVEGAIYAKQLRVALVIKERTTSIARGENKNRTLKNSNIVVEQSRSNLNLANGKGSINIPKLITSSDDLSLIVLIETADLDIVGGVQLNL